MEISRWNMASGIKEYDPHIPHILSTRGDYIPKTLNCVVPLMGREDTV